MLRLMAVLLLGMTLVGCQSTGPKQGVGTVIGAAGGGLLGAQFGSGTGQLAATAIGVLAGALIGSNIGQGLDDVDRMKHARATQHALESSPAGVSSAWNNPDTGHSGATTPVKTYQRSDGTYCREFVQTVSIGNNTEEAYGTACRQPDGSWKIVS